MQRRDPLQVTAAPLPPGAERVREKAAQGLTRSEIAEALGIGYDRVKHLVRQYRIAIANDKPGPRTRRGPVRPAPLACDAPALKPAMRRCLCGCGEMFPSSHPGERISGRCREMWSRRA